MPKSQTTICNPPVTWWHLNYWSFRSDIRPVTVIQYSPSSVWVLRPRSHDPNNVQRHKIACSGDAYFPSKQEAEAALASHLQRKIDEAHHTIQSAQEAIALLTERLNALPTSNQQTPEAA